MSAAVQTLMSIAPRLMEDARFSQSSVMVRCPFHAGGNEKTPSFVISLVTPVWFCHGCKASGHLAQLLRRYGLSRAQTEELLPVTDNRERKRLKRLGPVAAELIKGRDPYKGEFILSNDLLDDYRMAPRSLLRDGFQMETLRHFEVGYDAKNLRITYPLRNIYGDLVGVSGRAMLDGMEQRYKIYDREWKERRDFQIPEDYTMEGIKKAILWHGHVLRPFYLTEKESTSIVLVEGFKACMAVWQAGYQEVVALVGSYLTELQAELLARFTNNVIVFLDNNEAGIVGTRKAIKTLFKSGVEPRIARYPDEREQPDALIDLEIQEALQETLTAREWSSRHEQLYQDARYTHG